MSHFIAKRDGKGFEQDTIHYIVATKHRPTIILRHVFKDVTVAIDNNTFCNQTGQSVLFSDNKDSPQYAGIFLSKIFAYDDATDMVNLPKKIDHVMNVLDFFDWKFDSKSIVDKSVSFIGTSKKSGFEKSQLVFNVSLK